MSVNELKQQKEKRLIYTDYEVRKHVADRHMFSILLPIYMVEYIR
jgi:hypothetical protein